jgi:hypothetical protein
MTESPQQTQYQPPVEAGAIGRLLGGLTPSRVEELPNGRALYFDVPIARMPLAARMASAQRRMWGRLLAAAGGGFASGLPDPQRGGVGDSGVPTRTQIVVFQVSLTPASVATIVCAEQAITVTGVLATDVLVYASNSVAMATAVGAITGHVSAANTIALGYCNPTAGALVPTAGTYNVVVLRG